jgi:hypothetical protein
MPEGANIEIAHKLSEHERGGATTRTHEILEILEVVMLALVAVATAYSGYQAAKWDSRQALLYGQSSHNRFTAEADSTAGGQQLVADSAGFNAWVQARAEGHTTEMRIFEGRFSADYHKAFEAWLKTDPFHNPNAPKGPAFMPEYTNTGKEQAAKLNDQASNEFEEGTIARENADKYVRDTVLFASVLFLIAMAQRLKGRGPRIALNCVAFGLLAVVLISVFALPHL